MDLLTNFQTKRNGRFLDSGLHRSHMKRRFVILFLYSVLYRPTKEINFFFKLFCFCFFYRFTSCTYVDQKSWYQLISRYIIAHAKELDYEWIIFFLTNKGLRSSINRKLFDATTGRHGP